MKRSRSKITLVAVECHRGCGRQVTTLTRSIVGAHAAHAKFSGICQHCITPEEREEILNAQADAILTTAGR